MTQTTLFAETDVKPFSTQLLKWIGNKQRMATAIIRYFPMDYRIYYEPFLGSGGIMGVLAPKRGVGSDCFKPLIEIWQTLRKDPETLKLWYSDRWRRMKAGEKRAVYEEIKSNYNANPNGADLLFLCRSCYGGVVRFRKADGFMSTPCGVHAPIPPNSFSHRVDVWRKRINGVSFELMGYEEALERAKPGDFVYCDPPYSHSQSILYGAQAFSLEDLFQRVERCKVRGVKIAVSIDGTKKSGEFHCSLPIPQGVFEREIFIDGGRSMLKRFQMDGQTLETECVSDRLLLTY